MDVPTFSHTVMIGLIATTTFQDELHDHAKKIKALTAQDHHFTYNTSVNFKKEREYFVR
jgi:hypothetical protein